MWSFFCGICPWAPSKLGLCFAADGRGLDIVERSEANKPTPSWAVEGETLDTQGHYSLCSLCFWHKDAALNRPEKAAANHTTDADLLSTLVATAASV